MDANRRPADLTLTNWDLGGRIVFERYPRMRPGDRHLLMSVTKAFTSVVTGTLERRGLLDLGRPVGSPGAYTDPSHRFSASRPA